MRLTSFRSTRPEIGQEAKTREQYRGRLELLVVLALVMVLAPTSRAGPAHAAATRPDVILVVLDDARADMFTPNLLQLSMPNLAALMAARGVTFDRMLAANSWCCPGRASIQTGTWSHSPHNQVYTNSSPYGGWDVFRKVMGSTTATWLHDAGYRTGMMGKAFNGSRAGEPAPGWDTYTIFTGPPGANEGGAYYDYDLWDLETGATTHHAAAPMDYSTDVTAALSDRFLQRTPPGQPLFLQWTPYAPHGPIIPAPKYALSFTSLIDLPEPPSINEADVSDKPAFVQALPPWNSADPHAWARKIRQMTRTVASVDDGIGRLVATQRARGRLDKTVWLVTSDNGWLQGEHRWDSKEVAYEESIRLPLMIVAPGSVKHSEHRLVGQPDLAPTISDFAGVTPPPWVEGVSFRSLVAGPGPTAWRQSWLVEHLRANAQDEVPTFCAVRTADDRVLVVYGTGERELYDLSVDPYELVNRAKDPSYAASGQELLTRLHRLCSPAPPGLTVPMT